MRSQIDPDRLAKYAPEDPSPNGRDFPRVGNGGKSAEGQHSAAQSQNGDSPPDFPISPAPREMGNGKSAGDGFATRKLNPAEFRPVRFAWRHRLVIGALNILLGERGSARARCSRG
jgi:hypothetical protein